MQDYDTKSYLIAKPVENKHFSISSPQAVQGWTVIYRYANIFIVSILRYYSDNEIYSRQQTQAIVQDRQTFLGGNATVDSGASAPR